MADPIDTSVVIRFLVEDAHTVAPQFRGVFPFFEKLERGEQTAKLPPLVLFQSFFVLKSYYEVPPAEAAAKLCELLSFRGLRVPEKSILRTCLDSLSEGTMDLVDAYLAALCDRRQLNGVYSFDKKLRKLGVELLPVE